jgi:hypothetical protein
MVPHNLRGCLCLVAHGANEETTELHEYEGKDEKHFDAYGAWRVEERIRLVDEDAELDDEVEDLGSSRSRYREQLIEVDEGLQGD